MIRVLVVDDSPLVRRVISDLLAADPDIQEIETAANGEMALNKLTRMRPDVITMDLEMPGMGGLESIRKIMSTRPTPIVVISAAARRSARLSLQAIELGAIDVVEKPGRSDSGDLAQIKAVLAYTVKNAARVKFPDNAVSAPGAERVAVRGQSGGAGRFDLVALGASTGGPIAIKQVLMSLPHDFPVGIAIVQHMPAGFTTAYAERLNSLCSLAVREASDGAELEPGTVSIAPGNVHLRAGRRNGRPVAVLDHSEKVDNHRPSVDVLMASLAEGFGRRGLGVIMTGMGRDGVRGMRRLHEAGGHVIAQDEASSVIYGMNRAVIQEHAFDEIVALNEIAPRLIDLCTIQRRAGEDR